MLINLGNTMDFERQGFMKGKQDMLQEALDSKNTHRKDNGEAIYYYTIFLEYLLLKEDQIFASISAVLGNSKRGGK